MKNLSLVLNAILFVAVIVLFILFFTSKHKSCSGSANEIRDTTTLKAGIAFVNVDSLLVNYNLYNVLKDSLLQHQKQLEQEFGKKQTAFENEAAAFQRKVQANSFLSLESAQQQEAELYQKQQQLMNLKDDLSAKLMEQEQAMTKQIHDSIVNCVNIFNKSNKYKLILSNTFGGTIIYGDSTLNLTDTIQSILNSRFPKKK